jgi:hypothetical protein
MTLGNRLLLYIVELILTTTSVYRDVSVHCLTIILTNNIKIIVG